MKKIFTLIFIAYIISGCTIRKEGGTWAVKKTIVDEVQESIQDTKELASDMSDVNKDLSEKNEQSNSPVSNIDNTPPENSEPPSLSTTKPTKPTKKRKQ